jgi:hypothetical protein
VIDPAIIEDEWELDDILDSRLYGKGFGGRFSQALSNKAFSANVLQTPALANTVSLYLVALLLLSSFRFLSLVI